MPPHARPARLRVERLEDRTTPATLPSGFTEFTVGAGITGATAMAVAPNGDVWVLEQTGGVGRFRGGSTAADVVGNVSSLGLDSSGERGLLGIAFDPNYANNKQVYLYFTNTTGVTKNRVSRFTVNDSDPANYSFVGGETTPTQTVIVDGDPLGAPTNHNGGAIGFGPDGKLYIAMGDAGTAANAQDLTNRFGKILRVNSDGSVPADNPTTFGGVAGNTTGLNTTVWAVGLRNPYTFAFHPVTGRMFINDVGGTQFEEVNEGGPGRNFGWPATEGDFDPAAFPGFTRPVLAIPRGTGPLQGLAVAGGAFYAPAFSRFPPEFSGDYFYGDFVNGTITSLDGATNTPLPFASGAGNVVDLDVTADGRLLYLDRGSGRVQSVQSVGAPSAPILASAGGLVSIYDPVTRALAQSFTPYPGFTGGVRTAYGDVTGDGVNDIVVVPTSGGGPVVSVFTPGGVLLRQFFVAPPDFRGGLSVAVADVDRNGVAEIIVGYGDGGGPVVATFDLNGTQRGGFFAFDEGFRGGVRVAAADIDGDGIPELIATPGPTGGPVVRAFTPGGQQLVSFFAFAEDFRSGLSVTAADLTGDGRAEVVIGPGVGGGPAVQAFDPRTGALLQSYFAYDPNLRGGTNVATRDINGDGIPDILTGSGPGGPPTVRVFDGRTQADLGSLEAAGPEFAGGIIVG